MYRLGVDVGGTFTDVYLVDEDRRIEHRSKVPTTVHDQSEGVIAGVERVCSSAGIGVGDLDHFVHGTTVATNAVLERKGARVGLLTTEGYREVLHIGRSYVPGGLGGWLVWDRPPPLADLEDTYEVTERIAADGSVVTDLDEERLRAVLARIGRSDVESLTIAFVNSYANPEHEERAKRIATEELPGLIVTTSSEVLPELGEFERTLTAVANTYVRPVVQEYLRNLTTQLGRRGLRCDRRVLRSDGGLMTFEAAEAAPVNLLMSGPAGGVAAAVALGERAGYADVLTLDMGGTSTDVSLIESGAAVVRRETEVGDLVVRAPSADVRTVGAGGGSIARVPELSGALRVGPESAGATPGPVAYGRGGTLPTVTDANVVLGYLPATILGGEMQLDVEGARAAVERVVGTPLGLSVEDAAASIVDLANESMLGALRLVSVQQGHDPRGFALFAFGGAGPLHANALARLIGAWPVVIPPAPGVLCAFGDAATSLRAEASRSIIRTLSSMEPGELEAELAQLGAAVAAELDEAGVAASARSVLFEVDLRYQGQGFQLTVPVDFDGERLTGGLAPLADGLDREHERLFGFSLPEERETVSIRAVAVADRPDIASPQLALAPSGDVAGAVIGPHRVYVDGRWHDGVLVDRSQLLAGHVVEGPAVVVEMDSTTVVHPRHRAVVDRWGNLVIEPTEEGARDRG